MLTKYNEDVTKWLVEDYNWTEIDLTLELGVRATRILKENNITTIKQLVMMTDKELLKLKGFGKTSLTEVKNQLEWYKPHIVKHIKKGDKNDISRNS